PAAPQQQPKSAKQPKGKAEAAAAEARPAGHAKASSGGKARLREQYVKKVVPVLTKDFGYKNPMAVPKIEKVSINIGLGEATGNSKLMDAAVNELAAIAGQKPVIT